MMKLKKKCLVDPAPRYVKHPRTGSVAAPGLRGEGEGIVSSFLHSTYIDHGNNRPTGFSGSEGTMTADNG